jgi:DNA ligase-1
MSLVFQILEQLEATSSRLEKEKILKSYAAHSVSDELTTLFRYAMDPYKTYGVAKFKKPSPRSEENGEGFFHHTELLDAFASRKLTGNAAREALESKFTNMSSLQQKWIERVLLKNLKIGCTSTTINKVWIDLIPTFEVQLAEEVKTDQTRGNFAIQDQIQYPVYVDPKLDGLRMIAIKENGKVTLFSRNGQVFENFPSISASLESAEYDDVVLDGEVMGDDWNESQSIAFSKSSKKSDENMRYHVFDAMLVTHWKSQDSDVYSQRQELVKRIVGLTDAKIQHVVGDLVEDEAHLRLYYESCLDLGYEGIMVKDLQSKYQFKRTKAVRKLKPVATLEGVVSGWFMGHQHSKWEGKFGGFLIRLSNGVETRVGGGFSDSQREEFLKNANSYIDKIAECECQLPLTSEGRMRFPVFCRFRDEADVDPKVLG